MRKKTIIVLIFLIASVLSLCTDWLFPELELQLPIEKFFFSMGVFLLAILAAIYVWDEEYKEFEESDEHEWMPLLWALHFFILLMLSFWAPDRAAVYAVSSGVLAIYSIKYSNVSYVGVLLTIPMLAISYLIGEPAKPFMLSGIANIVGWAAGYVYARHGR